MLQSPTSDSVPVVKNNVAVAIVISSYYEDLVKQMESSARQTLEKAEVKNVETFAVPGSFEIPLACKKVIEEKKADGIIAIGIIVQGETHHAQEVARSCTDGLMQVQLEKGVPIANGILYVDSVEQAEKRLTRGKEATEALINVLQKKS